MGVISRRAYRFAVLLAVKDPRLDRHRLRERESHYIGEIINLIPDGHRGHRESSAVMDDQLVHQDHGYRIQGVSYDLFRSRRNDPQDLRRSDLGLCETQESVLFREVDEKVSELDIDAERRRKTYAEDPESGF